jgi:hypothetical protein
VRAPGGNAAGLAPAREALMQPVAHQGAHCCIPAKRITQISIEISSFYFRGILYLQSNCNGNFGSQLSYGMLEQFGTIGHKQRK